MRREIEGGGETVVAIFAISGQPAAKLDRVGLPASSARGESRLETQNVKLLLDDVPKSGVE